MTIRHLKVFVEVVNSNGIGKAADVLFTSQPAVSQTIAELEKYYGIKLFERLNRKLFITQEGTKLLEYARHIATSFDEMERSVGNFKDSSVLKVGATVTIGTCLLPQILDRFKGKTDVLVENTAAIEQLLLQSKIDIGLIEGTVTSSDIAVVPFFDDEIVFAAKDGSLSPIFIMREKGSGTREIIERTIASGNLLEQSGENYRPQSVWTVSNTDAIKNFAIAGQGMTAMSKLLLSQEIESGQLKVIATPQPITRSFVIAYHRNKFKGALFNNFVKVVEQCHDYTKAPP